MRLFILNYFPKNVIRCLRYFKSKIYKQNIELKVEFSRIRNIPRFTNGTTDLFTDLLYFIDSASFLFMYDEIFKKEIYRFETNSKNPYIIDCGANIGLSVIYFKKLFPKSIILAFEPDKNVFNILQTNVNSFNLSDVTLINKGCWNEETELIFYNEGADGGRITNSNDFDKVSIIKTTRLRGYLAKQIDFLKIDIEGAETKVLEDCEDLLINVKNLFVEYHSFSDKNQTLSLILQILSNSGFRYQVQSVGVFSPHPFLSINSYSGMDLQLNIFAFRN